jgi:colicin import membrane protein
MTSWPTTGPIRNNASSQADFMARQLKVFRTHLGFYDLIVAAPSKKAALEAWGASPHLFAQGFAAETTEPKLVEAAEKKPGVVLKRQFGSSGEFLESVESLRVPKASAEEAAARRAREREQESERKAAAAAARAEQRAEERAAEQREREALHEAKTAQAREKKDVSRRQRQEEDEAAAAAQAAQAELRAELRSLTQQHWEQLRDIQRRETALAKERREIEQAFEQRSGAIRRKLDK